MKKFAAVLAALLVLSCGTTVLAAPSQTAAGLASTISCEREDVKITEVKEEVVADALKVAEEKSANSTVLALVDVKVEGTGSKTITFKVDGVTAADNGKIFVLHQKADGNWEVLKATAGEGTVTATFTTLSPVAIVKIADDATTLPKTGAPVVLPVVALVCAAGAAGCAKKVKFN